MKEKRDWDQVFKDWESSGKTIKDYCKGNHISVAAFYKNKRVLNDQEVTETTDGSFTQINIKEPETITFTINDITITCNRTDVQVFLEVFR